MNQVNPTKDFKLLLDSMKHIKYELDMLEYTKNRMKSLPSPSFEKNIVLESFVIHCRNLLYFFHPKVKPPPDDILARDFF